MAGTNVGTAYVQIIPSADGISSGIQEALGGGQMSGIGKSAGGLLSKGMAVGLVGGAIAGALVTLGSKFAKFADECIGYYNIQNEAETKLATVMEQRMGATESQIQGIKDYASALQEVGVVGDEVALSGAQQLATFLDTDDALKTLMPAMENLAVQQNGVNVSAEQMTSISNMMGKAMQGQASALKRVGITMTDEQKAMVENGNEQERAAVLAQIITDNVGNMNEAMANTPQGQMQQAANTMGDLKEQIGEAAAPLKAELMSGLTELATYVFPVLAKAIKAMAPVVKVAFASLKFVFSGLLAYGKMVVKNFTQAYTAVRNTVTKTISIARTLKAKLAGIIPKLKLSVPKISVSGGKAPWGIGGKGTKPSFKVKWNKEGGIFDSASIMGYGVGEAGKEAILPLDPFWNRLDAMAESIKEGGSMNVIINLDGQTIGQSTVNYINGQTIQFNASPLLV